MIVLALIPMKYTAMPRFVVNKNFLCVDVLLFFVFERGVVQFVFV
jgi:hypothetical protein